MFLIFFSFEAAHKHKLLHKILVRFSSFLLFIFLTFSYVFADDNENHGIQTERSLDALTIDQWSVQEGLISNNLTSVFQSSSKFIWITTFNGIVRFDGINLRLYDKSNIPFLSSNGFYKTYEDSQGNLWFCSQSSGVIKYSEGEFSQILPSGKNSLSVRSILEDKEGNIWLGTNMDGLHVYKDDSLHRVDLKAYDLAIIMDLVEDDEGNIIIATNGDGLLKLRGDEIVQITKNGELTNNSLSCLFKDKDGIIYIGSSDGLLYLDNDNKGFVELSRNIEINNIFIDDYNNIWLAAEQGLFMINEESNTFKHLTVEDGLPGRQVSDLYFDHENSLWLSTKKAGLVRLRDGYFENIREKEGLSSKNVNIIVEHNDQYYVGCDDGNINIIEGHKVRPFSMSTENYNLGIRDIHFRDNGEMLIASYNGLIIKKNGEEILFDLRPYNARNDIRRILEDKSGNVWLGTKSSGVVRLNDKNEVHIYDSSSGLKANYILALEENSQGDIYVGTHSGGMSVIRSNGEMDHYPIEEGKSGILIFNIHLVDDSTCLISTNIGIYKFENRDFRKVDLDPGLNAETIFDAVVIDESAWLSSNIGLIRIKCDDIQSHLDNGLPHVEGRLFDRFDGMASHECTGATRMTLSNDGKLLVPTLGGVSILDPKNVVENTHIPEVYITDFLADFQPQPLGNKQKIVIGPDVVRYQFNFTSLSYIAPPKVQFKYKLSNIDGGWMSAGNEREVVYTNLPKGNYSFTVIASNNDNVWNEQGATIHFRVLPHFYETTFFYIAVVFVLALGIWGFIIWRVNSVEQRNAELKKLNEELDRFVYSASHDLRAPLSSVLGLVEIARLEETVEAKQKCLDMINTSVLKLDGFINDIIDYSRNQRIEIKPEELDIKQEVHEAIDELKYQDRENSIIKTVEVEEERRFVTDGRRLNIILKNIISNAIRYHNLEQSSPFIKVNVSYQNEKAKISISDNGIGIDKQHLENIFKMFYRADESSKGSGLGLYIVKETIDKLGGEVHVESQLNFGTTFSIIIPQLKVAVKASQNHSTT
jgi:signal transduction histidine kinase/ligand-binding sensor domain-containing protein